MSLTACVECGTPIPKPASRCPKHPANVRPTRATTAHKKARAQTLSEETVCWICEKPGTPTDPLTADHVIPRAHGGPDERWNYRAAHASCNTKRGAKAA